MRLNCHVFRATAVMLFCGLVSCLNLTAGDLDSVCEAAAYVVQGEWNYYQGIRYGGTVGLFVYPYYWWHAGEAFGGILDYYIFCDSSNETLFDLIYNGMYHQAGDDYNYIPSNQSMTEGNDDQGVWGLATMEAVERNFTNPSHSWLSMTQAIYNTMYARWDTDYCGGGLRWQIFTWNSGYDYKNSIANGCLFQIAARLARYTSNDTYANVAVKVWNWMEDIGFLGTNGLLYYIYDGALIDNNCTEPTTTKWSYTYGIMLAGCAYMYNYTEELTWLDRATQLFEACKEDFFVDDGIMAETSCVTNKKCNSDQLSFRSLFSRCLALTAVLVPDLTSEIMALLDTSAVAAAQSCSGGTDGVTCGMDWLVSGYDDNYSLGNQMCALEVMLGTLAQQVTAPYTSSNGGSSESDPEAGLDSDDLTNTNLLDIKGKDKAGAGVLTAIVLATLLGGSIWMAI